MTLKKYKFLDIVILTAMGIVADVISFFATRLLIQNHENVYIAPSILIVIFIYIRWNKLGIIPNIILLLGQFVLYGNQIFGSYQFAIGFSVGYLSLFLVVFLKKYKKSILNNWLLTILFYLLIPYAIMIGVEVIIVLGLGFNVGISEWYLAPLPFMIRHVTNIILLIIIMLIARRQPNFLVDMKQYLINNQKQREKEESNDS